MQTEIEKPKQCNRIRFLNQSETRLLFIAEYFVVSAIFQLRKGDALRKLSLHDTHASYRLFDVLVVESHCPGGPIVIEETAVEH